MRKKPRWAVFISGRGSNLQALLDLGGEVDIAVVVSSRESAPGVHRARRAGVPTLILEAKIDWVSLQECLKQRRVSAVLLAGFMRIVPEEFTLLWHGRIFNIHPSLLPEYPGLKSIARSYQEEASMGVSFHRVVPEVDAGELILQKKVFNQREAHDKGLTLEEAEFFIHVTEHRVIREALGTIT